MKLTEKVEVVHANYTRYQFTPRVEEELAKIGVERIDPHTDQYAHTSSRLMVYPKAYNAYEIRYGNSFFQKFGNRRGMDFERWEDECIEQIQMAVKVRTLLERLRKNGKNRKVCRRIKKRP